ncbi:branched-chain amino acid transport system permease LivM [Klebsiella pneumoniae]|uniref:Branched-chain amino acid transport system permease LivM n=1 Tax=Klebsiella pneumoniae TaxID=573 RepID=A0A377V6E2_KLEPN|nr:branched-chain amino acid transport system permease LivM [Klebsiella pneumoniae]
MGLAIVFPFLATKYLLTVAILGLIYVLLGLGLNIVVGLAGLLDLGYVAFYAIGAYGLALGYQYLGLGFWAMLPLGAVMAASPGRCWLSGAAYAWRLSGHRHPRLWRNYPPGA